MAIFRLLSVDFPVSPAEGALTRLTGWKWHEDVGQMLLKGHTPITEAAEPAFDEMFAFELLLPFSLEALPGLWD